MPTCATTLHSPKSTGPLTERDIHCHKCDPCGLQSLQGEGKPAAMQRGASEQIWSGLGACFLACGEGWGQYLYGQVVEDDSQCEENLKPCPAPTSKTWAGGSFRSA